MKRTGYVVLIGVPRRDPASVPKPLSEIIVVILDGDAPDLWLEAPQEKKNNNNNEKKGFSPVVD